MKRNLGLPWTLVVAMIVFTGCTTLHQDVLHDEIFTYQAPFDRGYLQILDIGNGLPDWTLESTSKNEGLLMFRKKGSGGDKDTAIVVVKNLDANLISMELARSSQRVRGVGELLSAIDESFLKKQKSINK